MAVKASRLMIMNTHITELKPNSTSIGFPQLQMYYIDSSGSIGDLIIGMSDINKMENV